MYSCTALWNRNYFLRFRFRFRFLLLKSYPVPVPTFEKVTVPVQTFEKVTVPVPAPYVDHKKQIFAKKILKSFLPFYIVSCVTLYKEKVYKFQQIYCKM
jgi:hypothetical protein